MRRRAFLATGSLALAGCRPATRDIEGGFTGIGFERGHLLRPGSSAAPGTGQPSPGEGFLRGPPTVTRRVHTLIAGGGVAGLAAARALRQRGMDDFALLELEDSAGGNSRGGTVGGIACPLGAHYLPVPGDHAHEVQHLLEEFVVLALSGKRKDGEAIRVTANHVKRALTNRSGRPQDGNALDGVLGHDLR